MSLLHKYLNNLARTKLGLNLSAWVTAIFLVTAGALAVISLYFITHFGQLALRLNSENLLRQAHTHLRRSVTDSAEHCALILDKAEDSARYIASMGAWYLDNIDRFGSWNYNGNETMVRDPSNGIFNNGPDALTSVVYWAGPEMSPEVNRERNALSHLDPLLRYSMDTTPGAVAVWFMSRVAMTRYYPNIDLVKLMPPPSVFDFRDDICFTTPGPENNPDREIVWTDIYQDSVGQGLMISVNMPCYDSNGTFRASMGIDISLNRFLHDVLGITCPCPNQGNFSDMPDMTDLPEFKFVLDEHGTLVAFPPEQLTLFGLPVPSKLDPGKKLGINLNNSTRPQVRQTAEQMVAGKTGIDRLVLGNTTVLVAYHPISPMGWSLGIAAPEAQILSSVARTETALAGATRGLGERISLIAILMLLLAPVSVLAFFSRRILSPLGTVLNTIRDLGKGIPARRTGLSGNDEMADLGREVDRMADHIEQSRNSLAEAEKQYRDIYENAIEGLFQITPYVPVKLSVNQSMAEMLGYDSPEEMDSMINDTEQDLYYHPEIRKEILREMGRNGRVENRKVRFKCKDGSPIWVQVSAKEVRDDEGELIRYEGFCLNIDAEIRAEEIALNHSRELITAGERERRRIALELHDAVGQDLSALRMSFEASNAPELSDEERSLQAELSRSIILKAIRDVRNLAYELRPSALEEMGLVRALESWLETIRTESGPAVDFQAAGLAAGRFGFEMEINVFRIVQEFVNNSLKHAEADNISVRLVVSHPSLIIRLEDDGCGFDTDSRPIEALKDRSMGLWGMNERTKLLNGTFHLTAVPGKGVRLRVEIPLPDSEPPSADHDLKFDH